MIIYIDRCVIKAEFKKVFDKWDNNISSAFFPEDKEKFLNELVESILEPVEEVK